jgi:hypothetical protein
LRYSSCSGFVFHEKGFIDCNENCDFLSYAGFGFAIFSFFFFFCLVDENCFPGKYPAMGKPSFKDSLKALEADIQHANTLYLSRSLSLSVSLFFLSIRDMNLVLF